MWRLIYCGMYRLIVVCAGLLCSCSLYSSQSSKRSLKKSGHCGLWHLIHWFYIYLYRKREDLPRKCIYNVYLQLLYIGLWFGCVGKWPCHIVTLSQCKSTINIVPQCTDNIAKLCKIYVSYMLHETLIVLCCWYSYINIWLFSKILNISY